MSREYKDLINENNIEGFTQMLLNSSSQQMVNWVSVNKLGLNVDKRDISLDNSVLAELQGYETSDEESKTLKRVICHNN